MEYNGHWSKNVCLKIALAQIQENVDGARHVHKSQSNTPFGLKEAINGRNERNA